MNYWMYLVMLGIIFTALFGIAGIIRIVSWREEKKFFKNARKEIEEIKKGE